MRKKIKVISIIISISVFASGCVLSVGNRVYNNEKMIAKDYDSYGLTHSKQHADEKGLTGSAECMEGMGTIWKFDTNEATDVNISYKIKISSGKAKLVLISSDDKLTNLVECTPESDFEKGTTDTFKVKTGESRIKLVGAKGTKIQYQISVDKGKVSNFN